VFVFSRYSELPAEIPIHWGLHGADRWADKNPLIVAAPALLGFVVLVALARKAALSEGNSYWFRLALMYALAALIGYTAMLPAL